MPIWVFIQAQVPGKLLEACFEAVMRLNTQDSFFLHWDMINYGEAGPSRSYLNGWGTMWTLMRVFSQFFFWFFSLAFLDATL